MISTSDNGMLYSQMALGDEFWDKDADGRKVPISEKAVSKKGQQMLSVSPIVEDELTFLTLDVPDVQRYWKSKRIPEPQ